MKRLLLVLILAACMCCPAGVLAEGLGGTGEKISMSGTVQGLVSTCAGHVCRPGEEYIIAAAEDNFVLLTDSGKYYFLPNLKSSQLARHIGKMVKVDGVLVLGGNAIMVTMAVVMKDGEWIPFHSPKIQEAADLLLKYAPH
jgi:hypothetical protein